MAFDPKTGRFLPDDLTGKRFGMLVCTGPTDKKTTRGIRIWKYRCDCGNEIEKAANKREGRSCGCQSATSRRTSVDHTGKRFGMLTAIKIITRPSGNRPFIHHQFSWWLLRCDCGNEVSLATYQFVRGHKLSCGCTQKKRKPKVANSGAHVNVVYARYRKAAFERKISFELSREQARKLFESPCHYCGALPVPRTRRNLNGEYASNGIDRINNNLGYSIKNSVPCCTACNFAKQTRTAEEFIEWIRKAYLHLIQRGLISP